MKGRVLVVAGSDSGAGAGIQADIKTVAALGGYATTAITALTAQNTVGVHEIMAVPPSFIRRQMEVVLQDIGADCIKTGMLHDAAVVDVVVDVIEARADGIALVVDPVLAATDGTRLLDAGAVDALKRRLIRLATVLTPNLQEAEILTGMTLRNLDDIKSAAEMLVTVGSRYVLVKGGHMSGSVVRDVFFGDGQVTVVESPRIETRHTHGTGCTMASGIAVGLAQGMDPLAAVRRARTYLTEAIRSAPGFGSGHGPLNHIHTIACQRDEVIAMSEQVSVTGRCECGAVRFTVTGALRDVMNCHCGQCRRFHGHVGAYTNTALDDLRFDEERGLRWYRSSSFAQRGFCGECGSSLFWQRIGGDVISIAAGCLDAPTGLRTVGHIFVAHRGDYYEIKDGLKQHPDGGES